MSAQRYQPVATSRQSTRATPGSAATKAARLKELIQSDELSFLLEAHNGLSAKIVEGAGFEAIWASGLAISAALGVRDSNEASWTQVLDVLEFMSDATRIPILVDGDTGYGNFNNMRRLVTKLEQRGLAGVCIEDKLFPKTNSFIRGTTQPLADIDEFSGRIKAGKDSQSCDNFVVVARVEAFIAGWGLSEALKRAEAYRRAGADAILIHSSRRSPREVLAFREAWGNRLPVVIVPTKYYATPTDVFREYGFSAVIWANHLMRSCITSMQQTAREVLEKQSLVDIEDRVAPLREVFRLQGADELADAENRYLPKGAGQARAVILAAAQGEEMGELTHDRPKCMVNIAGTPILGRVVDTYRAAGIKDIVVVRGYKKEVVQIDGVDYFDNEEAASTHEAYTLHNALPALDRECIICYGDVLFKKFIPEELLEVDANFAVMVDSNWRESRNKNRYADYVTCTEANSRESVCSQVGLLTVACDIDPGQIHGEWMGFLKVSREAVSWLRKLLERVVADPESRRTADMAALMRLILEAGKGIRVIYTTGNWLDIDSVDDVLLASGFQ